MTLKKIIKILVLSGLQLVGSFRVARESRWRSERLLILSYHGISLEDEHLWQPELFLTPQHFEERLQYLKSGSYNVLPLREALDRLYQRTLPNRSVVITVDDGNYDFYKHAFPLLQRYAFPVTVYLTTFYCEYNKPVFGNICSYMLWKRRGEVMRAADVIDTPLELDLRTEQSRAKALGWIVDCAEQHHLSAEQKNAVAERLARALSIDYEELLRKRVLHRMTLSEVAEIAAAGVDVQLHTHRHSTPEQRALFRLEIDQNRSRIESTTGRAAIHFCYPDGVCNAAFLTWLSEMGVVSATTCAPGLASATMNPLLLPRVLDGSDVSPLEFQAWASGLTSFLKERGQGNAARVA